MLRLFFGGRRGRGASRFTVVLAVACDIAVLGGLVMLLWNWLMPALFTGLGSIDYWQALGILLLCKILFGGRGHWRGHHPRWDSMSAEEREQLKRHFGRHGERRFGFHGDEDAGGAEIHDRPTEIHDRPTE
ncbi:MAG: hypothetical protein LBS49_11310 [Candidatus Accumulibacter sp.]|nr:hypothetical protein [Accumulibacter sp.]